MSRPIVTRAVWKIKSLCTLADHLQGQDRYREAEYLLQRALEIAQDDDVCDPPVAGHVVGKLGVLYSQAGRRSDAEDCYRRSIDLARQTPTDGRIDLSGQSTRSDGVEDVTFATHCVGLAGVLVTNGEYEEAELVLRTAYEAFRRIAGESSHEAAAVGSVLADLLAATDRAAEAAELYRKAVTVHRSVLDPGHPLVVSTVHNLALLLDSVGRPEEARALWDEAESALARAAGTSGAGAAPAKAPFTSMQDGPMSWGPL